MVEKTHTVTYSNSPSALLARVKALKRMVENAHSKSSDSASLVDAACLAFHLQVELLPIVRNFILLLMLTTID